MRNLAYFIKWLNPRLPRQAHGIDYHPITFTRYTRARRKRADRRN